MRCGNPERVISQYRDKSSEGCQAMRQGSVTWCYARSTLFKNSQNCNIVHCAALGTPTVPHTHAHIETPPCGATTEGCGAGTWRRSMLKLHWQEMKDNFTSAARAAWGTAGPNDRKRAATTGSPCAPVPKSASQAKSRCGLQLQMLSSHLRQRVSEAPQRDRAGLPVPVRL
jgi:hypothetical protein